VFFQCQGSSPVAAGGDAYHQLDPLLPSLAGVLSTLAFAGQKGEADVRRAFEKAMVEIGQSASLLAKSDCSLRTCDPRGRMIGKGRFQLSPLRLRSGVGIDGRHCQTPTRGSGLGRHMTHQFISDQRLHVGIP